MSGASGLISFLNREEMERLHCGALSVLKNTGMRIDHPEAADYLINIGCSYDENAKVVKFPETVVENAVEKMRRDYTLTNRAGARVPMRYTEMLFNSAPPKIYHDFTVNAGGFVPFVLDLDGIRRDANMTDVINSIRLADALPNIDLIGLPCAASEIPAELRPVIMTAELVKNTSKPGGVEAWSADDIKYISEMGAAIRGGADKFKEKPFLIGYGEAKSPLTIDRSMCEIFMTYIKMGLPQSLDTMPNAALTAPASSAGALVTALAETLSGLVLGYAIDSDAWVSIDINPGMADMRAMSFPYAGADRIAMMSAGNQMMREFYGRPGGCHSGKTDACFPGAQAGFEKALSMIFPIITGATGIGTVGQVEGGLTFSFTQLVIDNEIIGYIKRILRGFTVTDEKIALGVIDEIGPGGNFLGHEHTADNFRDEFYLSDILERMPWGSWMNEEFKGLEEKAREKAKKIIAGHEPEPLAPEIIKEIDKITERAKKAAGYS